MDINNYLAAIEQERQNSMTSYQPQPSPPPFWPQVSPRYSGHAQASGLGNYIEGGENAMLNFMHNISSEKELYKRSMMYRSIKDALTAPGKAYRGEIDPWSYQGVQQANNLAGMMALSEFGAPVTRGTVLGSGAMRNEIPTAGGFDKELQDMTVQKFGLTKDPREAGYILPDGSMLDFSMGYTGTRMRLHGDLGEDLIKKVLPGIAPDSFNAQTEAMYAFQKKTGALRQTGTYLTGNFMPTQAQIAQAVKNHNLLHPDYPMTIEVSDPISGEAVSFKSISSPTPAKVMGVFRNAEDKQGNLLFGSGHAPGKQGGFIGVKDTKEHFGLEPALPDTEEFRKAVANTPGARITEDGLLLKLQRHQKPGMELELSVRGGVMYLPEGASQAKFYRSLRPLYGGPDKLTGETLVQRPLFVKGATGGTAPETAYNQIMNNPEAYQLMRIDALRTLPSNPLHRAPFSVEDFLKKHAPEMQGQGDYILHHSKQGNQLPYALQEAAVASAARKAGYDSVVGVSRGKISEVFDVREQGYPGMQGENSLFNKEVFPKNALAFKKQAGGATQASSPKNAMLEIPATQLEKQLSKKYPLFDIDIGIKGKTLNLKSIAFDQADRSHGYGTQVLNDLKEYARKNGLEEITLMSAPKARHFYEKNGFVKAEGPDQYQYVFKMKDYKGEQK